MPTRRPTMLRWIEEADARHVREQNRLEREAAVGPIPPEPIVIRLPPAVPPRPPAVRDGRAATNLSYIRRARRA